MSGYSPNAWFTQVKFATTLSPRCQEASTLDANHEMKKRLMMPWIQENIRGKRVLDLFSANGAFAFECALAGAQEVVGIEFDEDRVRCAQFVAGVLRRNGMVAPQFYVADVYSIADRFSEPFDVVLCAGGALSYSGPALHPYANPQADSRQGDLANLRSSSGNRQPCNLRHTGGSNRKRPYLAPRREGSLDGFSSLFSRHPVRMPIFAF